MASMRHPPSLPLELYQPVIENVMDNHTILALILVSHTISQEAERVLYRSVTLNGTDTTGFLAAITRNKRLAQHVHRIRIKHPQHSLFQLDSEYSRHLNAALPACINLAVLVNDRPFIAPPSPDCKFQLVEFKWGPLPRNHDLRAFLASQPRIQRLEISLDSGAPPSSTTCLHLSALAGPTSTLLAFLPGRTVRYLHWHQTAHHDAPMTPANADVIAAPLRRVRALVLTSLYGDLPFPVFAPHLAELRYLELNGDGMPHIHLIKRLPQLRGLALRPPSFSLITDPIKVSGRFVTDVVGPMFAAIESLRFIEAYDTFRMTTIRWERGAAQHRMMPMKHDWLSEIE